MHTFPKNPHFHTPLYTLLSSPLYRALFLALGLLTFVLFGIVLGLYKKYFSGIRVHNDLSMTDDDFEWIAFGVVSHFCSPHEYPASKYWAVG